MTVKELIECLEYERKDREVLYGVGKKKVEWLHICREGIVLASSEDDKQLRKQS